MIRPLRCSDSSNVQIAAILIGVVAVLYLAREILVPLAFAIVLTFVLAPAVAGLQKLRIGRIPAVLLVMVVFMFLLGIQAARPLVPAPASLLGAKLRLVRALQQAHRLS